MITIQCDRFTLRVQGLCYESDGILSSTVKACGFDYLAIQYSPENTRGDIAFDSLEELQAVAPVKQLEEITRALDWQAGREAESDSVARAEQRAFLRSIRG